MQNTLTMKDASLWASRYIGKHVTPSNISYLVQYGKIPKFVDGKETRVDKTDLQNYYDVINKQQNIWKKQLGNDLNWQLSFAEYKETETTKHVHRLHPYKGKFIPQLVEYFLDSHTDKFKKQAFFKKNDIILDPFSGSGTVLVQANELSMHAIGIDVSAFNSFISNIKISHCHIPSLSQIAEQITEKLKTHIAKNNINEFDENLSAELKKINAKHFPTPDFRRMVQQGKINEKTYSIEKQKYILQIYNHLIKKYNISLLQEKNNSFLDIWFLNPVRSEIDFIFEEIKKLPNDENKKILSLILSRTMRSCRATTHADLGTLRNPTTQPYYCKKHGKMCKPLFTTLSWWHRYCQDTISRLKKFAELRTNTQQICLTGDSRNIDIHKKLKHNNSDFAKLLQKQKIAGIFSSPPYVGLIDYHEQHAYAYDLFGFTRRDELEIGPLCKGQSLKAQQDYIQGISQTLINCKPYMQSDYNVFLVANDKYGMYPKIAEQANMKIINEYKRPVLNRVEKDRSAYAEKIFQLQKKK